MGLCPQWELAAKTPKRRPQTLHDDGLSGIGRVKGHFVSGMNCMFAFVSFHFHFCCRPWQEADSNTMLSAYRTRGMVKTATSQNGDKPKRLQVQSKRINLLSSTMDLFSELLTKFQLIQLCSFGSAVIS